MFYSEIRQRADPDFSFFLKKNKLVQHNVLEMSHGGGREGGWGFFLPSDVWYVILTQIGVLKSL